MDIETYHKARKISKTILSIEQLIIRLESGPSRIGIQEIGLEPDFFISENLKSKIKVLLQEETDRLRKEFYDL